MTKAEIVNTIVLEKGINKKEVMAIVESLMEEIKNSLEKEESVYLREVLEVLSLSTEQRKPRVI